MDYISSSDGKSDDNSDESYMPSSEEYYVLKNSKKKPQTKKQKKQSVPPKQKKQSVPPKQKKQSVPPKPSPPLFNFTKAPIFQLQQPYTNIVIPQYTPMSNMNQPLQHLLPKSFLSSINNNTNPQIQIFNLNEDQQALHKMIEGLDMKLVCISCIVSDIQISEIRFHIHRMRLWAFSPVSKKY